MSTPPEPPRWSWWMPLLALVSGIVMASILAAVLFAAYGVKHTDDAPPGVIDAATILQDVLVVFAAGLIAAQVTRPRPAQFGLRPTPTGRAVGTVIVAYIGFIAFSIAYTKVFSLQDHEDVTKLGAKGSALALVASAFVIAFVAPVCEEVFFRGFLYGALRGAIGVWPAALVAGCLFGGAHAGSAPVGFLVPLALFGVLLCVIYERTGSLWPCICLHALNNSISLGSTLHWSWQIEATLAGSGALIFLFARVVRRIDRPLAPLRSPA